MKRLKKWKQPIISFLLGYMIFLLISFILQIQFYQELKTVELDINLKEIVLHTIKRGIFIYISVYFLIFTLNALYNFSMSFEQYKLAKFLHNKKSTDFKINENQ